MSIIYVCMYVRERSDFFKGIIYCFYVHVFVLASVYVCKCPQRPEGIRPPRTRVTVTQDGCRAVSVLFC